LNLLAYNIEYTGPGSVPGSATTTTVTVTANEVPAGSPDGIIAVKYTVTCGDGSSVTRNSPPSDPVEITVTAPSKQNEG
jgi:serine/threonine-protein kinase